MTGSFTVEVKNSDIAYKFVLHRNITVLRGDGASGKSLLCSLISENSEHPGQGITVNVSGGARIEVLTRMRFEDGILSSTKGSIIFVVDEDATFIGSNEFAAAVNKSGYYFLLITRDNLAQLSCSIKEVYELIHLSDRHVKFSRIYPDTHYGCQVSSDMTVITEDTKAGRQFFSRALGHNRVHGAGGRSKIKNLILNNDYDNCVVVADGAAFGFNIAELLAVLQMSRMHLVLEESFEYVILKSGVIHTGIPKDIDLDAPEVESLQFSSWELFYEDLLRQVTEEKHTPYKKEHLPQMFSNEQSTRSIMSFYRLQDLIPKEAIPTDFFGGDY